MSFRASIDSLNRQFSMNFYSSHSVSCVSIKTDLRCSHAWRPTQLSAYVSFRPSTDQSELNCLERSKAYNFCCTTVIILRSAEWCTFHCRNVCQFSTPMTWRLLRRISCRFFRYSDGRGKYWNQRLPHRLVCASYTNYSYLKITCISALINEYFHRLYTKELS